MNKYMMSAEHFPIDYSGQVKLLSLQSLESKYSIISNLGNGSFGSVVLAKYRKDKRDLLKVSEDKKGTLTDPLSDSQAHLTSLVAIKTMNKKLQTMQDYTRVKEVKFILSIPSHPSLVQIYEMFIDDVNFQLHISMESMNQNLYQLMKSRKHIHFSPVTLKSILTQILHGIRHIHRYDYFHRDVKPENILIIPTSQYYGSKDSIPPHRKNDNYIVKLADYGLARNIHNTKPYTAYVSTRWYRSPEILLRKKFHSKPVDIWAFGTIAVETANFIPLFPGSNELDQTWRILKALGSPSLPDIAAAQSGNYYVPLGGYWKEAQELASKLGFSFPYESGVHIYDILPNPAHSQLAGVVKACLTWDPQVRPDVEAVCAMPYFQNTAISTPYEEPERPSNKIKTRVSSERQPFSKFHLLTGSNSKNYGNEMLHMQPKAASSSLLAHNTFVAPNNSENLPIDSNSFPLYDDLDDGYENEFMKEYIYQEMTDKVKGNKSSDEVEIAKSIDKSPPELNDSVKEQEFNYYTVESSDNEEDVDEEYHSDQNYATPANDYSWRQSNEKRALKLPRDLKAIKEPMEEELIADLSFGSGHEIKC